MKGCRAIVVVGVCLLGATLASCGLLERGAQEERASCRERLAQRGEVEPLIEAFAPEEADGRYRAADLVWPLSGGSSPAGGFSETFGPRIQVSSEAYDFHRGLDLPTDVGTDIRAVADGRVRLAGHDADYSGPVVQIEHEGSKGQTYYSNYLHISSWAVEAGERVEQGEKVAEVGRSASGFAHLHFEIREGGVYRHHAVHPLAYLPYSQTEPPLLTYVGADRSGADDRVTWEVQLPDREMDLVRVGVGVLGPEGEEVAVTDIDLVEVNADNDEWERLDDPEFRDDVRLDPKIFRSTSEEYRLAGDFRRLDLDGRAAVVFAEDLGGEQARVFLCPAGERGTSP